jgi:hypothetical protein
MVYEGTDKGVYKSIDSRENWEELNDGLQDLNVNLFSVDPKYQKTIYAGTWNSGVYKYSDIAPTSKYTIVLQVNNPFMIVNGTSQELDPWKGTIPIIVKEWGRTVVPIRSIVEALGGNVEWNDKDKNVTIKLGSTLVKLQIGNAIAYVSGSLVKIDPSNPKVVPEIINNRNMLPLRFAAESLGCQVDWDSSTQTITINYTSPP